MYLPVEKESPQLGYTTVQQLKISYSSHWSCYINYCNPRPGNIAKYAYCKGQKRDYYLKKVEKSGARKTNKKEKPRLNYTTKKTESSKKQPRVPDQRVVIALSLRRRRQPRVPTQRLVIALSLRKRRQPRVPTQRVVTEKKKIASRAYYSLEPEKKKAASRANSKARYSLEPQKKISSRWFAYLLHITITSL